MKISAFFESLVTIRRDYFVVHLPKNGAGGSTFMVHPPPINASKREAGSQRPVYLFEGDARVVTLAGSLS